LSKNRNTIDNESILRNQKILDNINNNIDFQLVLADFALASIYDTIKPLPVKNLSFNEFGYTSFETIDSNDNTNIFIYKNIPTDIILDKLLHKLKNYAS
jgi:hypothetical protein